ARRSGPGSKRLLWGRAPRTWPKAVLPLADGLRHAVRRAGAGVRPRLTSAGSVGALVARADTGHLIGALVQGASHRLVNAWVSGAWCGGVASSGAALLVHRAVGDRLTCVFVDTGLLREGEPEQVQETFARHLHVPLIHVKAGDDFFASLAGVTDPETKRRIIGAGFVRAFEEAAGPHTAPRFLVQGTLYPDVIESGSKTGATIKTHHNVGGLPDQIDFDGIVEPLRDLFKHEVRRV